MTKHLAGKLLILFILLRLLLVILLFIFPDAGVIIDSHVYLDLASILQTTGEYIGPEGEDLIRPPAYPVFILIASGFGTPNPIFVALMQLALSGLISIILYWIGTFAGTERGGLVAGWLNVLSPHLALWSLTVMTETIFAFLLILGALLWLVSLRDRSALWSLLAGCAIGLATLFRPIGLFIGVIWFALALLYYWRSQVLSRNYHNALLILVGVTLFVLPWMLRNQSVHNRFTLSIVSSKTLYGFNLAYVIASAEGIDREQALGRLNNTGNPVADTLYVVQQYPAAFVLQQVEGSLRTMFGAETGVWARLFGYGIERQGGFGILTLIRGGHLTEALNRFWSYATNPTTSLHFLLGAYGMMFTFIVYALSIAGLFWAYRERGLAVWIILLLVITAAYLFIAPGAAGQSRFRVPAEPLLISLAGFGWVQISWWLHTARNKVSGPAAA